MFYANSSAIHHHRICLASPYPPAHSCWRHRYTPARRTDARPRRFQQYLLQTRRAWRDRSPSTRQGDPCVAALSLSDRQHPRFLCHRTPLPPRPCRTYSLMPGWCRAPTLESDKCRDANLRANDGTHESRADPRIRLVRQNSVAMKSRRSRLPRTTFSKASRSIHDSLPLDQRARTDEYCRSRARSPAAFRWWH